MKTFVEKNREILKIVGSFIAVAISTTWFMSHQIHAVEKNTIEQNRELERSLKSEIRSIDLRLTVIETILMMQGYPMRATAAHVEVEN